jgi:hypothetical protein
MGWFSRDTGPKGNGDGMPWRFRDMFTNRSRQDSRHGPTDWYSGNRYCYTDLGGGHYADDGPYCSTIESDWKEGNNNGD